MSRTVTITFDDEFNDKESIKNAIMSDEMYVFIWDLFQEFRNIIKYNEEISPEATEEIEKIKDVLLENLRDRGLEYILEG